MANGVYIVSAARTPIGKFGGMLADFTQPDLGTIAVRAALERAFGEPLPPERAPGEFDYPAATGAAAGKATNGVSTLPWHVDEVIFGNARPAGVGPNPARQIAWRSGLGDDVPAFTVNMACASGLRAVVLGWQQIVTGQAGIIVAGGAESMSRVPYLVEGRWGFRLGNQQLIDGMYRDGFLCPLSKMIMGETAEVLAEQYKISREEQDDFAVESHRRATVASAECHFKAEIVPVPVTDKKGNVTLLLKDEHVRQDASLAGIAKLPPVFSKTGTVTAGNSSGITDGAAAVVLASEEKVRELRLKPIARIVDATHCGGGPARDGNRSRAGGTRPGETHRNKSRGLRCNRAERSLRGASAGLRPRSPLQSRAAQSQWRRDRARPSDRVHRHPHSHYPHSRSAQGFRTGNWPIGQSKDWPAGSCHIVCVGWIGRGSRNRNGLTFG